ncbi:MAG: TetR/AcrR family transcriptional regulator [Negativicutes bacterium]|nr:TetR/AcrR family transcriptional regulator [Negativicutes bacterium]
MRNRIMIKTMEAMNMSGLKFTMADLAREMGVSKSTLYENFRSKEELIGAITDTIMSDLRQQDFAIRQNNNLSFNEKLQFLLVSYPKILGPIDDRVIDDIQRYMPQEWARIKQFLDERWQNIEQLIGQGIDNGLVRPINMAVLRKLFIGANNELFDYQFLIQNGIILNDALTAMAEVLMFGIMVPSE